MDDYVECAECGHPLERHTTRGCNSETCRCPASWAVRAIEQQRRLAGLPGRFNRVNY